MEGKPPGWAPFGDSEAPLPPFLRTRCKARLGYIAVNELLTLTLIPKDHPDQLNFLPKGFGDGRLFDTVICDGQVLRTHTRASYRENREARRLTVTQLALGLENIKPGGTMIVLLHKVEAMDTVELLYQLNRFSTVRLFKPATSHAKRSSFYMVASDIQI